MESLKVISKRSFSPSSKPGQCRDAMFPRTGGPPMASLPALQMRHGNDLNNAKHNACEKQGKFDIHV
jgi:hypothetical protein